MIYQNLLIAALTLCCFSISTTADVLYLAGKMPDGAEFPTLTYQGPKKTSKNYIASSPVNFGQAFLKLYLDTPKDAVLTTLGMPAVKLKQQNLLSGNAFVNSLAGQSTELNPLDKENTTMGFFNLSLLSPGLMTTTAVGIPSDVGQANFLVSQPSSELSLDLISWPHTTYVGDELRIVAKITDQYKPVAAKVYAKLYDQKINMTNFDGDHYQMRMQLTDKPTKNPMPIKIIAEGFRHTGKPFKRENEIAIHVTKAKAKLGEITSDADKNLHVAVNFDYGKYKLEVIYGDGKHSYLWAQQRISSLSGPQQVKIAFPHEHANSDMLDKINRVSVSLLSIDNMQLEHRVIQIL